MQYGNGVSVSHDSDGIRVLVKGKTLATVCESGQVVRESANLADKVAQSVESAISWALWVTSHMGMSNDDSNE